MGFACPRCAGAGTLEIARRIVLPGDRRSDEIALEILACACGFKCVAAIEQARRPALRAPASDRVGYRLPAAAVDLLAFLVARCPDAAEEYCPCPIHAALNRRDLRNRWNLLWSFAPFAGFALPPAPSPRPVAGAVPEFAYAPLDWARDGAGYRAAVEGRDWRLRSVDAPAAPSYELSIEGAIGFEIEAWPPFWRASG
jgi:hypothetical protein